MTKVQLNFCIDIDHLEVLADVKSRYHLRNHSEAVRLIINQWRKFIQTQAEMQKTVKENPKKRLINPQVIG